MSARRWSLRNRSAFWFTISAALFLGIAALVTDVAYRTLIAGELEEEAAEEIEEFRLRLLAGPSDAEWYARLLEPAGREDAETPAAWWVRDATGEHGPFGSRELARQRPPVLEQSGVTVRFAGALLHRREALDAGREVELVLDGSQWTSRLRAFEAGLFAVFVLGTLLSLVFGRLYSNRVARALEDTAQAIVASRTRAEAGSVGIADAPEEIRAVLEAAESMLRATRADSRRARLLTAGMAHDLRAPIQNLITATEVTLLKPREAQRYREALENRLEELRELGSTIDNLVSYCSPAISLEEHVAFDLREALSHALPREESAARRRGVLLDAEFRGELVLVGDAEALALVARNLIRNAVQWSPPGGEVHLLAESCDQGVRIAVEDQGPGVTPELEAALTSAELGVQRVPGRRAGYGLGLALAREVAVRHGGRLYAEAAALGGARLVLEIPRPA